jgi:hypothetical protein
MAKQFVPGEKFVPEKKKVGMPLEVRWIVIGLILTGIILAILAYIFLYVPAHRSAAPFQPTLF